MSPKSEAEKRVKEIRKNTRKKYSAEEKIKIVLDGIRGEDSIASICCKESIAQNLYYKWSKNFIEAGKKRLAGDIEREANRDEVSELRKENNHLKQLYASLAMKNDVMKLFGACPGEFHLFSRRISLSKALY